jgi:4-amino-4-deoxy-L-arabinose transferase-like glycosyltransferase
LSQRCLLAAAIALAFALPCFAYPFWLPDEPRVAHTSYEMGRSSSFSVPRVNGDAFLQVPPLYYWMLNGWLRVVGDGEARARLLSALCSLGTILVTALIAGRYFDRRVAWVTAAVLASTTQFWDVGHRVIVETGLAFFTTVAFYQLSVYCVEDDDRWQRGAAAGIALGLAFLCKGVPALVLFAALSLAAVFPLDRSRLRGSLVFFLAVSGGALIIVAPWLVFFSREQPGGLSELLLEHVFRRVVEGGVKNPSNFDFVHRTLANLLPWTPVLPFVLLLYARNARAPWRGEWFAEVTALDSRSRRRLIRFLLVWALAPILLLLLSRSKRQVYLMPILPAYAIMTSSWLVVIANQPRLRGLLKVSVWLLALLEAAGAVTLALLLAAGRAPAWATLGALVVLTAGAIGVWLRWRAERPSETLFLALTLLVSTVATWGAVYHVQRTPEKSLSAFSREVSQLAGDGYDIVGYRLSEREVGALAWRLRRPFPAVNQPQELATVVSASVGEDVVVVVEKSDSQGLRAGVTAAQVVARKQLRRRTLEAVMLPGRPVEERIQDHAR